jgi:glycerol-3-phosphate dehydrogenase
MAGPGKAFDVAVVGAGINGAGIARDAALRGLRVIVIEQGDLCSGTSAWSSRLIHGGLRYLEYGELPLVFESLRERMTLRRTAGHLVKPIRICIPIYESGRRGRLLIRLGMMVYDLLSAGKTVPRHRMLDRDELLAAEPGLAGDGLLGAACYYDAQVTYAERLVLENLLAARAAGADIRTYTRLTGVGVEAGPVASIEIERAGSGERQWVTVRTVVNAAGPWVDRVLALAPVGAQRLVGGTKGSHIVVSPFAGAPGAALYVEAQSDGRPFFIIPWNGLYLVGTTDIRYDGDPANARASRAEIDYLLTETNRVIPAAGLTRDDVCYSYSGVRPLPQRDKGPESAITRRHVIRSHDDGARGMLSIIGGKLTTYRSLAEQVVDRVGRLLGRRLPPCRTRDLPLPGARGIGDAREALAGLGQLAPGGIERLLTVYGGRAAQLAGLAESLAAGTLDDARTVLAAEVAFAIRDEMATTLVDIVHRRMMIGLDADQGRPSYAAVADLAARELSWSDARRRTELDALVAYGDALRGV